MKQLDRLVLKTLIPFFLAAVVGLTMFWFVIDPVQVASRYRAQGVPWSIILHIMALYFPRILAFTFPMGILAAVLLGYGKLSDQSETVAVFAGGVPFARMAVPALILGLLASGVGFWLDNTITSKANAEKTQIEAKIKKTAHQDASSAEPFYINQRDTSLRVAGGSDPKTQTLKDITAITYGPNGPTAVVHAATGRYNGDKSWTLQDASLFQPGAAGGYMHWKTVRSLDLPTDALKQSYDDLVNISQDPTTLDYAALRRTIRRMEEVGLSASSIRGAQVELWNKFALPLASFVFALVAAPLGLRPPRAAKVTGPVLALLIIAGYYVLFTVMSNVARGGGIPPALAAFLPDIIGIAVGAALIWRASR